MIASVDLGGSAGEHRADGECNMFAYGTMQFPAIAEAVTGRRLTGEPAVLEGYARHALRDEPYPGIVPAAGNTTEGMLYRDLDPVVLRRIDSFEDALYRREAVRVRRLADGEIIPAVTYVVRPDWHAALAASDWDPDEFARRWHDTYVHAARAERLAGELD